MKNGDQKKRDTVAQWAFDTRALLERFHLWLEDVEVSYLNLDGTSGHEPLRQLSFLNSRMESLFALTGAVTALGTRLFGRYGEGAGLDKPGLNQVKKEADAISAYVMSESLWYLSRQLPENHAILVCLGEGLMPKAGESPEMGANPQLGFGRVYARPEVAQWVDKRVHRLLNDPDFTWLDFYDQLREARITIWGAAIDTLENTSRFAKGAETGPMTVLHLFNQPLIISKPYEGYMGTLILPEAVVDAAADESILIDYHTPRSLVLKAIETAYPGIERKHIHVWTLRGKSREKRIGTLWQAWQDLGVDLIEDGWLMPNGMSAFTESGTYAPTYHTRTWTDGSGKRHLFLCDGYAASAEAMQAASLYPLVGARAFLSLFSSSFKLSYDIEWRLMAQDPNASGFAADLKERLPDDVGEEMIERYRQMVLEAVDAGMPAGSRSIEADRFFPEKTWRLLAVSGFMCDDPYSGLPGVEEVGKGIYRVTTRLASSRGQKVICFTLRLKEPLKPSRLVFNPLLIRFFAGEDFRTRAVKISDSGRIRNELQTLCSEALEFLPSEKIKVVFERIPAEVISMENQRQLKEILTWYKENHPLWFSWLILE